MKNKIGVVLKRSIISGIIFGMSVVVSWLLLNLFGKNCHDPGCAMFGAIIWTLGSFVIEFAAWIFSLVYMDRGWKISDVQHRNAILLLGTITFMTFIFIFRYDSMIFFNWLEIIFLIISYPIIYCLYYLFFIKIVDKFKYN